MQCLCELGGFCNGYLAVGKVTLGGNSSQGLKSTFFRSKNLIYKLSCGLSSEVFCARGDKAERWEMLGVVLNITSAQAVLLSQCCCSLGEEAATPPLGSLGKCPALCLELVPLASPGTIPFFFFSGGLNLELSL